MLASQSLVAFVGVTDPEEARHFYGNTLGLPLVEDTPFALVFDAHGTNLRVTKVDTPAAAPYTVLGWDVDDIVQMVDDLTARGVVFTRYDGMDQDQRGIWHTPDGGRVAWFADPSGNVLSLSQPAG